MLPLRVSPSFAHSQADNTCWTEEAHVGVGFNDDSDLSQIEAEPTSIVTTVHCVDVGVSREDFESGRN